jgi:hypothetical protein
MPAGLFDRSTTLPIALASPRGRAAAIPDPGYEALSRLTQLGDFLSAAFPPRSRWKEPPLFFFDTDRETQRHASRPNAPVDPLAAVSARIGAEMPLLCGSVEVRRVARTIPKLRSAAEKLAPLCTAARGLVELLAVPDDEAILALHPESRSGFRITVRGVADVGQFHVLMAGAISSDPNASFMSGPSIPERFAAACRNVGPPIPAGIPMVFDARFQMYTLSAIRSDGTLPTHFEGCDHWLWPASPLAAIPRLAGERVVLLGAPAFRQSWDVSTRFSGMPADLCLVETLGAFRVADELSKLTGKRIAPIHPREQDRPLARAA